MTACLMVRAEVAEAARAGFDRWYEAEHLPQAKAAFGATAAWRGWSAVSPGIHIAFYEFPDLAGARAILGSDAMKAMIAEFDRTWPGVPGRSREIVETVQKI